MSNNIFTSFLDQGFSVFPLPYGKKEPNLNWKLYQTHKPSLEQCQKWDEGKHNVAIATGKISNIFVVDVDGPEGEETIQDLENLHGPLPKTITATTGRGKHLYYRYPAIGDVSNLAGKTAYGVKITGIDIRGDGGYVVAPPSMHPDRKPYSWVISPNELEIAQAPEWLLKLVVKPKFQVHVKPTPVAMGNLLDIECDKIKQAVEGQRNHQLNKSAFILGKQMHHLGLSEHFVRQFLKKSALSIGLEERETDNTINSGITSGKAEAQAIADIWSNPNMSVLNRREVILPKCPHYLLNQELSRYVTEAAQCKSSVPDYIFAGLLCAAAGLIGNSRRVEVWEGWVEATGLWFMLVGLPSSNKSPALDAIFAPLRSFEAEYNKQYKQEYHDYKIAVDSKKAEAKSSESLIIDELVKPVMKRIIVNDTTVEKLALLLSENHKGLIYSCDELAGLLANLEKNGGSDRPFYLESFGGRSKNIDRVKYDNVIYVPSLLLSIIGSIQPDKLDHLLLRQPDDGLASRFLYIYGEACKIKEPDVKPDILMLKKCFEKLKNLSLPLDDNNEPDPIIVPFSIEARRLMEDFGNRLQAIEEKEYGMLLSHIGKLSGIVARLSLVLAYLEWSLGDVDQPSFVSEKFVSDAIQIVEHYFYPMSKHCLSAVSVPLDEQDAFAIAMWIKEDKKATINARDVLRNVVKDSARRNSAIQYLEESGWLKRIETTTKSVNYEVNPRIFNT